MRLLRAFARFWYDFLVGDDWKIAVSVLLALLILVGLLKSDAMGEHALTVAGGLLLMAAFTASLLMDVRRSGRKE